MLKPLLVALALLPLPAAAALHSDPAPRLQATRSDTPRTSLGGEPTPRDLEVYTLVAEAHVRSGRRIVSCEVRVRTEDGEPIATGMATLAVR